MSLWSVLTRMKSRGIVPRLVYEAGDRFPGVISIEATGSQLSQS